MKPYFCSSYSKLFVFNNMQYINHGNYCKQMSDGYAALVRRYLYEHVSMEVGEGNGSPNEVKYILKSFRNI